MISVHLHQDIRKYKEKLYAGLTARQLFSLLAAFIICVPVYIYGSKILGEDLTSYIVIGIAMLFGLIGFIEKNGMTYEKYLWTRIKQDYMYPRETFYKSYNLFRTLQEEVDTKEKESLNTRKMKKYRKKATLERALLMEQAEERGEVVNLESLEDDLLTVRKPTKKGFFSKKPNGEKKDKKKKERKSRSQIISEEVEMKKEQNPYYVPTKKEEKMLIKYAKEVQKKKKKQRMLELKEVVNKNNKMKKRRVSKSFIPQSTQDDLPYEAVYEEGMFEVEPNKYAKSYELKDINYFDAKEEEALNIFYKWGEFLNSLPENIHFALFIDNRRISIEEKERRIFTKLCGDEYDIHRKEYNKILRKQITAGRNDIEQNKFITATIDADSPYEALLRFRRLDIDILKNLNKIGTTGKVVTTNEKLAYIHDAMRRGKEGSFSIDYDFLKAQGLSSKDYVAPHHFDWKKDDYFKVDDTYYRCMYLCNLPSDLSDEFIKEIQQCNFSLTFAIHMDAVRKKEAIKVIKHKLTGIRANKIDAVKTANKNGYSEEVISDDLKISLKEAESLFSSIREGNEKLFYISMMVKVGADTLEELEDNTEILMNIARGATCEFEKFTGQQRDAYKVIFPIGVTPHKKLYVDTSLTTNSVSIFIPFASQELFQLGGFYYGLNQNSKNLIYVNRKKMKSPSGFIMGSSGSGKSFAAKREMLSILLTEKLSNLFVIDPDNEYIDFGKLFKATILYLGAGSEVHMNLMDMTENYGLDDKDDPLKTPMSLKKEKALKKKSSFLMSIITLMLSTDNEKTVITPAQRSQIDKAIRRVFKVFLEHDFDMEYIPTIVDLQEELERMYKEETLTYLEDVVAAMEYFTKGSMNMFSYKTNVDLENRFVIFALRSLEPQLKRMAMMAIMDFIWNKTVSNMQAKVRTYAYVDEIISLLEEIYTALYIKQYYQRGRKYGLITTGICQDVEELLNSKIAKAMLTNSDFILMFNQKSENMNILANMLNISDAQRQYAEMSDAGDGLLFAEKVIVPFHDDFPQESYLYTLMSTAFDEDNTIDIDTFIAELQKKQEQKEAEKAIA